MTVIVQNCLFKSPLGTLSVCCTAIKELFENDETGQYSLEMVKLIADLIHKRHYQVPSALIDVFQHLELQADSKNKKEEDGDDKPTKKPKKRKGDPTTHVTKRMKKVNKYLAQAMEEVQEAEAVYDKDLKQKHISETLKFVFLTYFRILKNVSSSPLIPSVLEGLSKFAHLINVDFFQDLLAVLKTISINQYEMYLNGEDGDLGTALSALHCVVAAFELLDSVGGAIAIDLKDFYTALYTQISRLAFRPGSFDFPIMQDSLVKRNEVELLLKGLDSMLKKNREVTKSTSLIE
jgi:nucleolar complex protein 3